MPMYQFRCECGFELERLVSIQRRDKVHPTCSRCGRNMKRVPTAANFGKPKHQTQAILGDGRKVGGTWVK